MITTYSTSSTSVKASCDRLEYLLNVIPKLLEPFTDEEFSKAPGTEKWSRKEILGHLIDSATNNHHRFIRSQFEEAPLITYKQNEWNKAGYYSRMDKAQLINFWKAYNRQILELIKLMPHEKLSRLCNSGDKENHTLEYLFIDYVAHLEHHLRQMVKYD